MNPIPLTVNGEPREVPDAATLAELVATVSTATSGWPPRSTRPWCRAAPGSGPR